MLLVMHGWNSNTSGHGALDGWDLRTGEPKGRWSLGEIPYDAMCHDGEEILFARHDEDGPALEASSLPSAFAQIHKRERLHKEL